jgi:hypothetical protein
MFDVDKRLIKEGEPTGSHTQRATLKREHVDVIYLDIYLLIIL